MALINVRFYTILRRKLGVDSLFLEATDIEEAIAFLEERIGSRFRQELHTSGKMQENCIFLLNGINLRNLKRFVLEEGDVLHVFLPTAGG
ncbi:MAG: MoaD/ThiS family protein [Actinomycetota bacterium]|nr:MoaD/ThiS family protein [Actinomycetota bacterium]